VLFLGYLGLLYDPINAIMYTGSAIQSAAGSARRVAELLEIEPQPRDTPNARPLGRVQGSVRLCNVSFGYGPDRPVLRNVSLEVRPGETCAIVGPTGAGKSTLVSLIPRFHDPSEGVVLVDGTDVRSVRVADLRSNVSLVLQDPLVFPLSIAENIAYGRPDASEAEIEAAARAANAHAFIERLPRSYATVVGEGGWTLSGGERQRLSIARALLKDAPILILDEPTSSLDAQTEAEVLAALGVLIEGRTTIIIAHRLATVEAADRIIVLQDGTIAESGTHAELMRTGGVYSLYVSLQRRRANQSA
jgi:ATP-binding cassette subfamily B protein